MTWTSIAMDHRRGVGVVRVMTYVIAVLMDGGGWKSDQMKNDCGVVLIY